MNQSGIEANISIKLASRAGKRMRVRHDWFLVLLLTGLESGARVLVQSESEVKQNQSKHNITFHTHLEKLFYYSYAILLLAAFISSTLLSVFIASTQRLLQCQVGFKFFQIRY